MTGDGTGDDPGSRFRGPRRAEGAPVGPEAVRRAVLDAAARLFAEQGVGTTTRRNIAEAADVDPNLINRYVGSRDQVVIAVLNDLSAQLAEELTDGQLAAASHDPDSVIVRWVRIMAQVIGREDQTISIDAWNPVAAVAAVGEAQAGLDPRSARVRAAQVSALAFGWRLIESYLVAAGDLDDVPLQRLREELNLANRLLITRPLDDPL